MTDILMIPKAKKVEFLFLNLLYIENINCSFLYMDFAFFTD